MPSAPAAVPKPCGSVRAIGASHARLARRWVSRLDRQMRCALSSIDDHSRGQAERGTGQDHAFQHTHLPQHVVEAAPGQPVYGCRNASNTAEFGRDHQLALVLGFHWQQAVAVYVDIDVVVVGAPGRLRFEHRATLHRVRDLMHM